MNYTSLILLQVKISAKAINFALIELRSRFRREKGMKKHNLESSFCLQILFEQYYVDWRDKNGEMIFEDLGAGNYTLAVMAGKVPLRYRAPVSDPSLTGYPSDDDDEEIEIKVISLKIED